MILFLNLLKTLAMLEKLIDCFVKRANDVEKNVAESVPSVFKINNAESVPDTSYFQANYNSEVALIMRRCVIPITCSAVFLALLREAQYKLSGEEKYYLRHGHHKSSLMQRATIIIHETPSIKSN
eukprot:GHVL01040372.1.p1 GENE.GHVL01040372.1~~GHVL01040372.1.p1  ORF type:complete len:125 (+),score=12.80 GHVL01040372.1:232-606(+)